MPSTRLLLACILALATTAVGAAEVVSRVDIQAGALTIDHGKSIAEITRMQANGGRAAEYGLGLFLNHIAFEFKAGGQGGRPGDLNLLTGIRTQPTIYIAREFPENSCAYAAVLEHERLHYQFDLKVLRTLPDLIRGLARDVFSRQAMASQAGQRQAMAVFTQRVRHAYDRLSFPQHVTIDNPESYRRLGSACQGEIGRYLKSALAGLR